MSKKVEPKKTVTILNIGTRILLIEIMDQMIRKLGNYRTYYATSMESAIRQYNDIQPDIVFSEADYPDGSFYRFIQNVGWSPDKSNTFMVLAADENKNEYIALASELELHSIIIYPFNGNDLQTQMELYVKHTTQPIPPWRVLISQAMKAESDKRFTDSETAFVNAIKVAPDNPLVLSKAGMFFLNKGNFPVAEKCFKDALNIKAEFVPALSGLGQVYFRKKNYEESEKYLQKAYNLAPLNPDRLSQLVKMRLQWGIEICRAALRLDPAFLDARLTLGKLYAFDKDYAAVVRELEPVTSHFTGDQKLELQTYLALAKKLGKLA